MINAENVAKVVDCILKNDFTISETRIETGFSERTIQNYIKALNNPDNKNVYNPKLYQKVRKKQLEIAQEKRKLGGKKGKRNVVTTFDKDMAIANLILKNNLKIEQAAEQINVPADLLCSILEQIKDETLKNDLKPILEFYHKGKLCKLRYPTQLEIILMALTFRVSQENLIKLFGTTLEDLLEMFSLFPKLQRSLYYLNLETKGESTNQKRITYFLAKKYWLERTDLIEKIKTTQDIEEKNLLNEKLSVLRRQVSDSILEESIQKKYFELTEEEQDKIAQFPVKYTLSMQISSKILKRDPHTIAKLANNLAERDLLFAKSLEFLNSLNDRSVREYKKEYFLNKQADLSQKLITLKEPINPDYFNIKLSEEVSLESDEPTRGGGTRK